jgi:hypothetical protein
MDFLSGTIAAANNSIDINPLTCLITKNQIGIMRIGFDTLLVILSILFFGFAEKEDRIQQPTISQAIARIKKHVDVNTREVTIVTIVNSHNGRYTITSSIWTGPDSVRLLTHIIDMMGAERDTIFSLEKKKFLSKLDRASYPTSSFKLAGHHQTISVRKDGLEDTFETTDGRALMNLLEYGE